MVLFLQERVTVELNHLICDAVRAQEVSDSLRDENDDLTRGLALFSDIVTRLPWWEGYTLGPLSART